MIVYAIKFSNNTFYAGCNKTSARTVLGAQLYKSEKTALNTVNKSINFPLRNRLRGDYKIVPVEIKELNDDNA